MSVQARSQPAVLAGPLRTRTIDVTSGVGTAKTALAAFDAALREAGVANFNLIHLSSVIPPDTAVVVNDGEIRPPEGTWGDRLYVVMADCRVETPNEEAWAGVGWAQDEFTGRGLFVEHFGHSRHRVEADIEASLLSIAAGRPEMRFGDVEALVRGTTCEEEPVCALVAAVYASSRWPTDDVIILP